MRVSPFCLMVQTTRTYILHHKRIRGIQSHSETCNCSVVANNRPVHLFPLPDWCDVVAGPRRTTIYSHPSLIWIERRAPQPALVQELPTKLISDLPECRSGLGAKQAAINVRGRGQEKPIGVKQCRGRGRSFLGPGSILSSVTVNYSCCIWCLMTNDSF